MRSLALLLATTATAVALDVEVAPIPRKGIDVSGFKAPKDLIPADKAKFKEIVGAKGPVVVGYLGVEAGATKAGKPVIEDVAAESPAEAAGLLPGDLVTAIDGEPVTALRDLRDRLRGIAAGSVVKFALTRAGKAVEITVTAKPASKPLSLDSTTVETQRPAKAVLGIQMDVAKGGGAEVTSVTDGGAASKAGLKEKDVIVKADETKVADDNGLRDVMSAKKPGEMIKLVVVREKKELELQVTLGAEVVEGRPTGGPGGGFGGGRQGGWDDRLPRAWGKPTYKLAVFGVEFPDTKHGEKIDGTDWEKSLFSYDSYFGKSATGQPVHGSMNDYYKEISYGKFSVSGSFMGWAEMSKKRGDYGQGAGALGRTQFLTEAMEKATAKFGKDAFQDYDGLFILYAGGRATTNRGTIYWPHRASLNFGGKRWPYFIVNEFNGGSTMQDISVFCHEFGHMLGLPDLYAQPEKPGMEGVGSWCAMSQQNGAGKPQHFSAWCKEQLGWVKPTIIDPRVKQKVILSPIEDDPTQCIKIPVRADLSEYFLIENRKKKGYDAGLKAEGLLIWRVTNGRVLLEESHGIEGAAGPGAFPESVPFPSGSNTAFTPFTTPSSRSALGGGLDVYITNIRKLPDGRITFGIGYQYQ